MSNMNSQGAGSDAWVHSGAASTSMNSTLPDDILSFYPDSGLDTIAREAGVIEVEVATQETPAVIQPQKNKTFKIIAVTVPPKHQLTTQIAQQTPQFYFTSPTQMATELKTPNAPKFYQLVSPAKQTNQTSWAVPQIKKKPVDNLESYIPESRRRKGSHSGKGLRHFSMKVCEKVQRKQITSYNEVADELVNEIFDPATGESDQSFDQKNIRRRVYDALNVLMAMNIISKEKKEIKWIGLPTNSDQECQNLEAEKRDILERMKNKSQQLKELVQQQIAFKQLVERNRKACQTQGHPPPNTTIQLPFILLTTCKKTVIDCSISNDKYEFLFNFDQVFSIHDDIEVLKRMGLALNLDKGSTTEEELKKAMKMVPAALHNTLYEMTNRAKRIKLEPGTSSGFHADESLDGEVTWGGSMVTDASRQSSCASRSDQPSPDYTDSVDSD